ncbi:hypothetical protein ANCDUO_16638 [Ancylostoma duodenale]|uniref:Uncharacterized protein n=1 Tax=Ancylostoma duodenale TaxID=51022 RepID=A0A0C2FXE0_9BILA|nr:hypothetical protein ANCDUO_16638 [Ancylostoma duodenale]
MSYETAEVVNSGEVAGVMERVEGISGRVWTVIYFPSELLHGPSSVRSLSACIA